jgi:tRNA A37 threonylcarbamoyladenosine synthetase subunit TsaC/SUA5/YrdC
MSPTVKLDSLNPDDNTLKSIVKFITTGKTIAFPTETFYALGVSACNEEAIKKVFTMRILARRIDPHFEGI